MKIKSASDPHPRPSIPHSFPLSRGERGRLEIPFSSWEKGMGRGKGEGRLELRPRRAEQVPSVSCLDATPERDAAPRLPACLRAPSRSHPPEWGPCSTFRRTFPCTGEGHGM